MLVLAVGGLITPGIVSASGIQSILVVASFVGFVAAGQMFVVLLGGIDLSVPWVLNSAVIVLIATSLGQDGRALLALGAALGTGLLVRLVSGVGVAYLAVPAVVMTLGLNGIMEGPHARPRRRDDLRLVQLPRAGRHPRGGQHPHPGRLRRPAAVARGDPGDHVPAERHGSSGGASTPSARTRRRPSWPANNIPEHGRSFLYGVTILIILLLYGRSRQEG